MGNAQDMPTGVCVLMFCLCVRVHSCFVQRFCSAMNESKLQVQVGANFQTLHIRPPSPQTASSKTSKEKLTSAVKKTVAVAKVTESVLAQ